MRHLCGKSDVEEAKFGKVIVPKNLTLKIRSAQYIEPLLPTVVLRPSVYSSRLLATSVIAYTRRIRHAKATSGFPFRKQLLYLPPAT